jgi:hypothetical protein
MDQNEKVIFAELGRQWFDSIVEILKKHFGNIQYGSQGDDWIWITRKNIKIEIDTFYSANLEVKGPRKGFNLVQEILNLMNPDWIEKIFTEPKPDLTE